MTRAHKQRVVGIVGIAILVLFIVIISVFFVSHFGDLIRNPYKIRETVSSYGIWGYCIFSLFNIFQIIFAPVPGHVVTISSGILFGFFRGIVLTWMSVLIGGSIVMVISRYYGRRMIDFLLDKRAARFEAQVTRKGVPFILLLSVFPNPLGDGLFYLAGITTVPLKILIPVIAVGRLPGIVISVLVGDRIMNAGIWGWVIGGCGFGVALVIYLLCGKRIEIFVERVLHY